jgi:transcriptional regulator with XRE-family HTH domain
MNTPLNIYDYVMSHLRAKRVPQRQVARESGVPFSTVAKIAQESVKDPSVSSVQRLYDYFIARENTASAGCSECGVIDPRHAERRAPDKRHCSDGSVRGA